MNQTTSKPTCPQCGRPGVPAGDLWKCPKGHGFFDNDPEEGGQALHNNPARAAEMRETNERRKAR